MFARLRFWSAPVTLLLATMWVSALSAAESSSGVRYRAEPVTVLPEVAPVDPARKALGQALFFDRRLSADEQKSCGDCHLLPAISAEMGTEQVLEDMRWGRYKRNLNLLYNVQFYRWFNWDGRYRHLETLIENSVTDLDKFNTSWDEVLPRLVGAYQQQARTLYQQDLNREVVVDALVQFVTSLRTAPSPFDRYLAGDQQALTQEQQRGYELFKRVGCSSCHHGRMLGGNLFEQFYLYSHEGEEDDETWLDDLGRYYLTGEEPDRHTFRVPSLRDVALTAPYFHDGSASTLSDAVEEMAEHQLGKHLSSRELELLVEFLISLTGTHSGISPVKETP